MSRPRLTLTAISLLTAIGGALMCSRPVAAGPVTNPGQAPYTKLGVYQGVISIVANNGKALELGNLGRHIAGTANIYFQPGLPNFRSALGTDRIVTIRKSATYADAVVDFGQSAQLCLNTDGTGYVCQAAWSGIGGSEPYWERANGIPVTTIVLRPLVAPLTPSLQTYPVVRIGSANAPVPSGTGSALDILGGVNGPLFKADQNLYTGVFGSSLNTGSILVQGQFRLRNFPGNLTYNTSGSPRYPWTSGEIATFDNLYRSNIDADTFDRDTPKLFPTDGDFFFKTASVGGVLSTAICLRSTAAKICAGGSRTPPASNAGTPCPNGTECRNGAQCVNMCGGDPQVCTADLLNVNYSSLQPANPGLICSNPHKRFTYFCRGGTAPSFPGSIACVSRADCTSQFGASATCDLQACGNTCNGPAGIGHLCTQNSDCTFYGNLGCGLNNCENNGVCRANTPDSQAPGAVTGFCYHDEHTCTQDGDCTIRGGASTVIEQGQCHGMGYCSNGSSGVHTGTQKHCQGGTRALRNPGVCVGGPDDGQTCRPTIDPCGGGGTCQAQPIVCDRVNVCIGGSGDSQYDDQSPTDITACLNSGGQIGNAVDYCPDAGSTCVADQYCASSNECGDGQTCIRGQPHPTVTAADDSTCTTACQAAVINRCRGATDVFGTPVSACSESGNDPLYVSGVSSALNSQSGSPTYLCACSTTLQNYSQASTATADLCTPVFQ